MRHATHKRAIKLPTSTAPIECSNAFWGETARSSPNGIAGVLGVVTGDERVVLGVSPWMAWTRGQGGG